MSAHAFREHGIAFQPIDEVNKYDGLSLLNEQGDLYFLLTNFGMSHKPLWIEETKKKIIMGRKGKAKSVDEVEDANYNQSNDSRNLLSQCCLNCLVFFFTNYILFVPYARDFLPNR